MQGAKRNRRSKLKYALRFGVKPANQQLGFVGLLNDPRTVLVVRRANFRHAQVASRSVQKACTERLLELGDLLAYHGLGQPQPARCLRKTLCIDDRGKDCHSNEILHRVSGIGSWSHSGGDRTSAIAGHEMSRRSSTTSTRKRDDISHWALCGNNNV